MPRRFLLVDVALDASADHAAAAQRKIANGEIHSALESMSRAERILRAIPDHELASTEGTKARVRFDAAWHDLSATIRAMLDAPASPPGGSIIDTTAEEP